MITCTLKTNRGKAIFLFLSAMVSILLLPQHAKATADFLCGDTLVVTHQIGDGVSPETITIAYPTVFSMNRCWLGRNLGAKQSQESATDTSLAAVGWYWQFNMGQGYINEGPNGSGNTRPDWVHTRLTGNSSWQLENDPCRLAVGDDWRLPRFREWQDMWAQGNTGQLNLHAAGELDNQGVLVERGNQAKFWSSTRYRDRHAEVFSVSHGFILSEWANGHSVRCISESLAGFNIWPGFGEGEESQAVAVDPEGFLYSALSSPHRPGINRLFEDGTQERVIGPSNWQYNNMRIGADDTFYLTRGGVIPMIYRTDPANPSEPPSVYVGSTPINRVRIENLELDDSGNIWAGGRNSGGGNREMILHVNTQDTRPDITLFPFSGDIHSLRLHGGYLYVGAVRDGAPSDGKVSGVWRMSVVNKDSLGQEELVASVPQTSTVRALAFTASGDLLLGTSGVGTYPRLMRLIDNELHPLFENFFTGNANFDIRSFAISPKWTDRLIVNVSSGDIIVLDMKEEMELFSGMEPLPTTVKPPAPSDNPDRISLMQNYPNPFNSATRIGFQLPESSQVRLEVYDITGRLVAVLAEGEYPAGRHQVAFDAGSLASGVYVYRLQAGEFSQSRSMILVR